MVGKELCEPMLSSQEVEKAPGLNVLGQFVEQETLTVVAEYGGGKESRPGARQHILIKSPDQIQDPNLV